MATASLDAVLHQTLWKKSWGFKKKSKRIENSFPSSCKLTQRDCVSSSFVSWVYLKKKIDVCGWKTQVHHPVGRVGHNIYSIQTWISDTTTKGQNVFTDWIAFRMSRVMQLVREWEENASRWKIFPHLIWLTCPLPITARYSCISWDDLCVCVCVCDVWGRLFGSTPHRGARPLLGCVTVRSGPVRVYRLSACH